MWNDTRQSPAYDFSIGSLHVLWVRLPSVLRGARILATRSGRACGNHLHDIWIPGLYGDAGDYSRLYGMPAVGRERLVCLGGG